MSTVRRVAANTVVLLLGQIVSLALGFFFTMYTARYLGAEGYGVLSFALAFTGLFAMLADMGLSTLMVRDIARDGSVARKHLHNVTALKTCLSAITFGIIVLVISLLDYPPETVTVVYLFAISTVINSFNVMFYGLFRGHERMEFASLGQVLTAALTLCGALLVINHHLGIVALALVYCGSNAVVLLFNCFVSAMRFVVPGFELDLTFSKRLLARAWPFGVGGTIYTAYYWTDSLVLSFMKGQEAVGWYNAAYKLVFLLTFIPTAYFGSLFPLMSRLHITSANLLSFTYEKSFKYMLILGAPIAVGTMLLAHRIIAQIYGHEFSESTIVLQILVWSTALQFTGSVHAQLLNTTNRQMTATVLIGATAAANLVLDLILVPKYGLVGCSAATLGNVALFAVLGYAFCARLGYRVSVPALAGMLLRVAAATGVMAFFLIYFRSLSMYILIPVGALVYFAVLCLLGGVDKEDRLLISQLMKRDSPDTGQASGK